MITTDVIAARGRLFSSLTRIGEQGGKIADKDREELGLALTSLGLQEITFNYDGGVEQQHLKDVSATFSEATEEVDHAYVLINQITAYVRDNGPSLAIIVLGTPKPIHLSFVKGGHVRIKIRSTARIPTVDLAVITVGADLPRPQ